MSLLPRFALLALAAGLSGQALSQSSTSNQSVTRNPGDPITPITLDQAMADPDWIGPPVESAGWEWDNQRVHYRSKRTGSPIRDTTVIALATGEAKRLDESAQADLDGDAPVYDRARQRMATIRNGDVFVRNLVNGGLQQVTRSRESEADVRFSSDGNRVYWRVDNDWFQAVPGQPATPAALPRAEKDPLAKPAPDAFSSHQLRLSKVLQREKDEREALAAEAERLRKADPSRAIAPSYLGDDVKIADSSLSPDGRWLLVVVEAKGADEGRIGKMPRYITESGYEETEDVRVRVGRNLPIAQSLRLVNLLNGEVTALALDVLPGITDDPLAALRRAAKQEPLKGPRAVRVAAMAWSGDGAQAAIQLRAIDNKDRWLATVDFSKPALVPAHRLTDPGWINWNFNDFGWLPDGRLWLLSEQTGYSHLYVGQAGKKLQALTGGAWEASSPVVSADGQRFFFLCNRHAPGDYEICAQDLAGGDTRELTALDGVEDFTLSPDGQQLLVRWSSSYLPPQLSVLPSTGGAARQLTDTRSNDYKARNWIAPQIVQVPSRHGAGRIAAKFYRPATLEPGRKYPVVMFVHGAGYLQNVHARFPAYFREQMFHNLLVQNGYLVLDMDYRGSEGYGRDWRTAIYRQMGHPELEDYIDGAAWLVDQQQGDPDRVGIYGGSYGGFMTFMALFREPGLFKAGAALRPVSDWTSYNHEYTANILNTPDLDPEAYRVSSPIEYVENFRGHLLISHGMIDDNVMYQDSVRMAQRLIELKKDHWELASYPMERHGYRHPESWYDQYRRIYQLFERTLK